MEQWTKEQWTNDKGTIANDKRNNAKKEPLFEFEFEFEFI